MKNSFILFVAVLAYITVRTINFSEYLNFSSEQAIFSTKALELWENREITLVGPAISIKADGREIFQSSATYYLMIPFLLAGGLDPVKSSYLLVLLGSLMVAFLYFGVKWLSNKSAAILAIALFSFFPFYVDYSRFFWNPNFQLLLSPVAIFLFGLYKSTKKTSIGLLAGTSVGFLLLLHYQFVIVIIFIFAYLLATRQKTIPVVAGVAFGFFPMIAFELKNNFYTIRTILYVLNNSTGPFVLVPHYILSISLFILVFLLVIKNISLKIAVIATILLAVFSISLYSKHPAKGFGMASNWYFSSEKYAYEIIKNENLDNYSVVNLIYDTEANVQRYLHYKDNTPLSHDYTSNLYLFIVSDENVLQNTNAYEVVTFHPSRQIKTWTLGSGYNLYLLKRLQTPSID